MEPLPEAVHQLGSTAMRYAQTVIAAGAIVLSIMGGAITGYITTRTDIAQILSKISEHELRLSALDRELASQWKDTKDYQTEMRAAVAHAVDLLTDLRLQVAGKPRPHG